MLVYVSEVIFRIVSSAVLSGDYEDLDAANISTSGNFSGRYRSYRGVSVPTECPAGSYCPSSVEYGTQYLCPAGSYSNQTGLAAASQCTPCDPGYYCAGEGEIGCHNSLCDLKKKKNFWE